jgi:hypothetical protein
LARFQALGDLHNSATALSRLAAVQAGMGDHTAALQNLEKSLHIHVNLLHMRDWRECGFLYLTFGRLMADQKNFVRARQYLTQSLTLFQSNEDLFGMAWALQSLGDLMAYQKKIALLSVI